MSVHAYTSITSNYFPKARVLARTLKKHNPDVLFHVVLSDDLPSGFELKNEPFDSIIHISELPVENWRAWSFHYSIVELCTAVKGFAAQHIFEQHGAEKLFYFDPDMAIFGKIDALTGWLDSSSVLLTPHLAEPETELVAILDNEISSLKHGVFNLGFLGLASRGDGLRFAKWWAERLRDFCYADLPGGLFTDQRWVDLAPCFFEDIRIIREPEYNVATWNISKRKASGSLADGVLINGRPLILYHFSGFDSGAQELMLDRYMGESRVLKELRDWYIDACETEGQSQLGKQPWCLANFDNGEKITPLHRRTWRIRGDVREAFPDPYVTSDRSRSFFHWFEANAEAEGLIATPERLLRAAPRELRAELTRLAEENARLHRELALINRFRGSGLLRWVARRVAVRA